MRMYAFGLPVADAAAVQALVDDQLNRAAGRPGRFVVAAPVLTLTITATAAITSEVAPYADLGAITEREAMAWVPVRDTTAGAWQPLAFYIPFTRVDSPLALAAGREIYGFPKDPAEITMPPDAGTPGPFAVTGPTVVTAGGQSRLTTAPLIEVEPQSSAPSGPLVTAAADAFHMLRALFTGPHAISAGLDEIFALLTTAERRSIDTILLKQMRDAADGLRACYQAIIRVPVEVTAFHGLRLLDPHLVTLHSTTSDPLPAWLGVQSPQASLYAFCLEFDSRLGNGAVVAAGASETAGATRP